MLKIRHFTKCSIYQQVKKSAYRWGPSAPVFIPGNYDRRGTLGVNMAVPLGPEPDYHEARYGPIDPYTYY